MEIWDKLINLLHKVKEEICVHEQQYFYYINHMNRHRLWKKYLQYLGKYVALLSLTGNTRLTSSSSSLFTP